MRLEEVVAPTVSGMGYELVDVHASSGGRLVRLFIDKAGGVTLDDCAAVSNQVTRVLAVEGIDYERLEVSSPGLDRPLRKEADFARFAGRRAEIRMRTADPSGRRKFAGVLRGAEAGQVVIELEGRVIGLELADLDRARLIPDFETSKLVR